MVHADSISFAAPSQLRFHLVADAQGSVRIAVLNPYNQPMGALRDLATTVEEANAFLSGQTESVTAQNETATCKLEMGTDMDHKSLRVTCEEPARWFKLEDFLIIEEFRELLDGAAAKASGASVV